MFEKLQLHNFQKHRRLSLNFSPTITTLVGDSRRGKSSVFRAIRLLAQGGSCAGLVTHGEDSLRVTLHVDSHRIKRVRSKEENSYKLDTKDSYRAVRQDVPEDIQKLLEVSDINFQSQFDPPFWMTLSPAEAARELNRIVSLDLIDSTLANIASELRKIQSHEEVCKRKVEQSEKRLSELSWVPLAQKAYEEIELLEQRVSQNASIASSLTRLVEEGHSYSTSLQSGSRLILEAQKVKESLERLTISESRCVSLSSLIRECESVRASKDDWQAKLEEAEVRLRELQTEKCPLCGRE